MNSFRPARLWTFRGLEPPERRSAQHNFPKPEITNPKYKLRGLEVSSVSKQKIAISKTGGAESGAVDARNGLDDADLQAIVECWPDLPQAVKADIVAMVQAAGDGADG